MLRWQSDFVPGIYTEFKEFSGEYKKRLNLPRQLIFHRGAKQKVTEYLPRSFPLALMSKQYRYSIKLLLLWLKSKAQVKHFNIQL